MSKLDKNSRRPAHEDIAACAQIIYEMEGRPEGRAVSHWLLAESLLIEDAEEGMSRPSIQTTRNPPDRRNGSKRKSGASL
jgi:hypothetical protein